MNKSELVEEMASAANISKAAAEKSLNGMLQAVSDALASGDRVTLVGFGTFSVAQRAARQGRNPQTGDRHRGELPGWPAGIDGGWQGNWYAGCEAH